MLVIDAGELETAMSVSHDYYVCWPVCVINGWIAVPWCNIH